MAPKKGKNQAKRSNIKIKSKTNPQKRGLRGVKSRKLEVKPEENLKWYSKKGDETNLERMDMEPDWINNSPYKKDFASSTSSEADSSGYVDHRAQGVDFKSAFSDVSDECNCNCEGKFPESKFGILKRKSSSANYVVAKYLKSGMDHVAAFIVESAIRFGKQHGVVIPDKNIPNVYEILPPHDKRLFDDKCRRIRFKIPEKAMEYEKAKKLMWKSPARDSQNSVREALMTGKDYESSPPRGDESLRGLIPLLEKFKKGKKNGGSEVEFKKLSSSSEVEQGSAPASSERERKRQREKDRSRDRDVEKGRIREVEMDEERGKETEKDRRRDIRRERDRARHMAKERIRKKMRALERFKRRDEESGKKLQNAEYSRKLWKKFPQDSLELGRQRLRASTCPRKSDERSETPIY